MHHDLIAVKPIEYTDRAAKDIMTLKEAAAYMGISTSCLYKKTMKREISFFRPGGKMIYFRKKDLDNYMLSNPHISKAEMAQERDEYLAGRKKKTIVNNFKMMGDE